VTGNVGDNGSKKLDSSVRVPYRAVPAVAAAGRVYADKFAVTLTTGQVAQVCKAAPRTVCKWMERGILRGYRVPGSADRRFRMGDVIAFMAEYGIDTSDLRAYTGWNALFVSPPARLLAALNAYDVMTVHVVETPLDTGLALGTATFDAAVFWPGYGLKLALTMVSRFHDAKPGWARAFAVVGPDRTEADPLRVAGCSKVFSEEDPIDDVLREVTAVRREFAPTVIDREGMGNWFAEHYNDVHRQAKRQKENGAEVRRLQEKVERLEAMVRIYERGQVPQ
jgi:hypothetical protein